MNKDLDEETQSGNPGLRFLVLFAVYTGILFAFLLYWTPLSVIERLKEHETSAISTLANVFSIPLASSGISLSFKGFPLEMTLECTAVQYMIIAASAVLAYPRHSPGYKAIGVLFMTVIIFLLNAVRIVMLGMIGHYAYPIFNFVHVYLWEGTFALAVLLLWVLWERRRGFINGELMARIVVAFLAATFFYALFAASINIYASLLAAAANAIAWPVSFLFTLPDGFFAKEGFIVYQLSGGIINNKITNDVMNTVTFAALVISTADIRNKPALFRKMSVGFALLFMIHLFYVVMYGILWASNTDEDTFLNIIWLANVCSVAAPLLIWLVLAKVFSGTES